MNRKTKRFLVMCIVLAAVFTFPTAAEPNRVAEVSVGANGIHWQPTVSHGKLNLTVSRPDGTVFSKTFEPGSGAYFDLSEDSGSVVDGSYTYELRVFPTEIKLRKAAEIDGNPGLVDKGRTSKLFVQSGTFTVRGGAIVTGGTPEPGSQGNRNLNPDVVQGSGIDSPMDQVILDDLIVDGSLCVGQDCVNGENFGFDTIRLKENNLRIKFQDTSNSGSFPSNDWQIIINDSSNGGANFFGIDDIDNGRRPFSIEASAPTNSLYVDDGGRVGFGTSTPVVELHVKDGDTPTLRLEQDGSSGFTAQTWDVAGNETNFFVRDVTNSSKLPFRIRPTAPTNSIYIDTNGKVGLGTDSPDYDLHISRSDEATFAIDNTGGATAMIKAGTNGAQFGSLTNNKVHFVVNDTSKLFTLNTDGNVGVSNTNPGYLLQVGSGGAYCDGTTWHNGSSREYKKDIQNLEAAEAMETLAGLTPVKFKYKQDDSDGYVGFIAEDVPELVATKDRKSMVSMDVVAVLTKVVQEQQKTIDTLNKRIAELEKKSQKDK